MGTSRPIAWLSAHQAQRDVLDGLARFDDWESLWRECPRGDWLLGIAERIGAEHTQLVRAAIQCVRITDDAPATMLDLCERWTRGEATAEEVARAADELDRALAGAADPASEAAMRAALAVGMGVADRAVLSSAPAAAVESVMMASIDCGFELAMRWAQDKCAAAVRSVLTWELVAPCVERLEDRG
ncbi:MAG: hypothetical protein KIT84_00960 [Labilithrix sp.]|nr:hypothetical protein [Labilithrix sp.]MCW5809554.1 hypothetical protein [Labilithrix sp.]